VDFALDRLPRVRFGAGAIAELPALAAAFGSRALLITGAGALQRSAHWAPLCAGLAAAGIDWCHERIADEPSPQRIDAIVADHRGAGIELVIGIGGGSALDAAKAVAGLLPLGEPVTAYLEGVGDGRVYRGPALPLIAAPTTAGTGSEATKNAVITHRGADGFKKSFRDARLLPALALVDPLLLRDCPRPQLAANAMDALTQLIEARTSLRANPPCDALAESGLAAARRGIAALVAAARAQPGDGSPDEGPLAADRLADDRLADLAYASLLSGVCLAQVGLGAVHGLASPLGAFFPIPHGVVCGALLAAATRANLAALGRREPHNPALAGYAAVARLLGDRDGDAAREALPARLEDWVAALRIPRLGDYAIAAADFPRIIAASRGGSMRSNPLTLDDAELAAILAASI